jgi:hypothetical protein
MAGVETQEHDIESGIIFGAEYEDAVITSGQGVVKGLTVLSYNDQTRKYTVCTSGGSNPDTATAPSCLVAVNGEVNATASDKMTRILIKGEVDINKVIYEGGDIHDIKVALRDKGIILRKTTATTIL